MKWVKRGIIFAPSKKYDWMSSHASVPVVDEVLRGVLRLYFGTRDRNGCSQTSYVDVDALQPESVLYVHHKPVLPLGEQGTFDDRGIMPSWIVNHENKKYLYYIGWSVRVTVPYHLAIGLAISEDGGENYYKISAGPLLDRSINEPFFNTAPCVMRDGPQWRMWYVSCTGWETVADRREPRYHVRYAESIDGIFWEKRNQVCLDGDDVGQVIGRPCVYKQDGTYRMFYSYRSILDYRTKREQSYTLGYAESTDGLSWVKRNDQVGIEPSNRGWDSRMIEYCYFYKYQRHTYLFYNGNDFGKTGIGYAVLDNTGPDRPSRRVGC